MNQLRFEAGLGHYSVNVAPDSEWIFRGMGTHYFQVQLQIGIPEFGAGAGRLLCVETTLYAPEGSGPRVPLASTNASVPFNPEGEVRMPTLQYLINRSQEILEFAGGKVSLGWVTEIDHSAKLDNLGELTTWYDTGRDGRIEVRLALANNNQMTVRLSGAHEETDIDPPHRSHPELTSHSQQRPQCERIVATTATDRDVNRHPVTTTEEARLAAAAPGVGNRYT